MPSLKTNRVHKDGFTLVEIMVVVVVIGILASLALPAFMRTRNASTASKFANDLRILKNAALQYNFEYGEWAGDGYPGTTPDYSLSGGGTGTPFISASVWEGENAFGGSWDWEGVGASVGRYGISSRDHSATDEQLVMVDEIIDDGDLATGKFRKRSDSSAFYRVETNIW